MVELLAEIKGSNKVFLKYLPQIRKEYEYFTTEDRTIDGLQRFWDKSKMPRPESYYDDIETKRLTNRDDEIFRDIRAACESGWDFTSRWFEDKYSMTKINATDILAVDLNCMLYHMESVIGMYDKEFITKAETRKQKIIEKFWNPKEEWFYDYNFKKDKFGHSSLAGLFPLYLNLVNQETADKVLKKLEENYLFDGGLVATIHQTGQQWDYPNGWAPLQWIGYKAAMNYNNKNLAKEIAIRWINLNERLFLTTGKMYEKYDVVNIKRIATGGEYAVQEGFGWTNGVFLKLYDELRSK
jgi:alpha,alpha-trehalase